jgi:hypothetical protein
MELHHHDGTIFSGTIAILVVKETASPALQVQGLFEHYY